MAAAARRRARGRSSSEPVFAARRSLAACVAGTQQYVQAFGIVASAEKRSIGPSASAAASSDHLRARAFEFVDADRSGRRIAGTASGAASGTTSNSTGRTSSDASLSGISESASRARRRSVRAQ
jgi:hypothetical protein